MFLDSQHKMCFIHIPRTGGSWLGYKMMDYCNGYKGVGNEIQVLLELDNFPIAIYNGMHMGLSFHPELNGVTLFHDSLFGGSLNSNFQALGDSNAA